VVLTVLVTSLCLTGPAAQAGPLLEQYFPLQTGDEKTFDGTVDGTAFQEVQTITSATFDGNDVFAGTGVDTFYGGPGSTAYVNYSGDQLLWYGGYMSVCAGCSSGGTLTCDPPVVFLDEQSLPNGGKFNSSTTATVTGNGPDQTYALVYSFTVTSAGTVTVPAGTFSNCVQLAFNASTKVRGVTKTITVNNVIFAPDVGIVQEPIGYPYRKPNQVGLYQLSQWSMMLPYAYATNNGAIAITGYDCSSGDVTIPDTIGSLPVTGIGSNVFDGCTNLASVTIPASITDIGDYAFYGCSSLTGVYFEGNAPSLGGSNVFVTGAGYDPATAYYLQSATGFGTTYGGLPTALFDVSVCTYKLSKTNVKLAAKGGPATVKVTTRGTNCEWSAVSNDSFITVTKVTEGSNGVNKGSVVLAVAANPVAAARTGTVTVASQAVTIAQAAAKCAFTLDTNAVTFTAAGGSSNIVVTANGGACAWTAANKVKFITITSATSFSGDGTVTYTVGSNVTAKVRTGTMTIAKKRYKVTQAAAP